VLNPRLYCATIAAATERDGAAGDKRDDQNEGYGDKIGHAGSFTPKSSIINNR